MAARLLLDENLAPGLVRELGEAFPGTTHVRDLGLRAASDDAIWKRAADDGYLIVTKDDDFRQRSFLRISSKVIWLRAGNCRRLEVAYLILERAAEIQRFATDPLVALLILTRRR